MLYVRAFITCSQCNVFPTQLDYRYQEKQSANESTHVSCFCADQVVAARQIHGTRDDAKCYAAD